MRKLGVEEWLVSAVTSMYNGAKTVVRTVYDNRDGFEVKVGIHSTRYICRLHPQTTSAYYQSSSLRIRKSEHGL